MVDRKESRGGSRTRSKEAIIESYLEEGAKLRMATMALREEILRASDTIAHSFRSGGKLLTFGNGGSAADAQHIAAEFSGRFRKDRPALPAIALTVNPSALTAIANDYSYEEVFARQVLGLAREGDVVMGISTSGSSKNVLLGLDFARKAGARTIGLCGSRGEMGRHADILLAVSGETTSLIQEVHIAIGHLLALLVEEDLFGR